MHAIPENRLTIDFFLMGLNHPAINAWFGGMYSSFFDALRELGCNVTYSDKTPNKNADVLVVPAGGGQDKSTAKAMRQFSGPVILNVGAAAYWFRKSFLDRWHEQILFAYGTDCSDYSPKMFEESGIPYYHFPFASTPKVMHPLDLPKIYDVVFVGNAGSGIGRHKYIEPLMKAISIERVLLVGPGWERYGFPNQSIAWGPLLNIVYNLANVCINISNDEQKNGSNARLDANNRLFDLAMAGCFQLSNAPEIVRRYFNHKEVIAIDTPDEWVSTILYFLKNPSETVPFKLAARRQALNEHTWERRAEQFIKMVAAHLSDFKISNSKTFSLKKISRMRDTHLPPYGLKEFMGKVRRRFKLSSVLE